MVLSSFNLLKYVLQSVVQSEVEQLRLELQATVSMYERACEELVHAQNKVEETSEIKEMEINILIRFMQNNCIPRSFHHWFLICRFSYSPMNTMKKQEE